MDIVALKALLTATGRMLLTENMLIVSIILWTVKGHFKKLEAGVAQVATKVGELSAALISLESKHSERIEVIERKVERLEDQNKLRRSENGI